jgi:hypothetical protein
MRDRSDKVSARARPAGLNRCVTGAFQEIMNLLKAFQKTANSRKQKTQLPIGDVHQNHEHEQGGSQPEKKTAGKPEG